MVTPLPGGTIIVGIEQKFPLPGPGAPQTFAVAGFFNLLIRPGETYSKIFQVFDEDMVPIDLTGFDTLRSVLRDKFLQDGGIVLATPVLLYDNQTTGRIDFEIPAVQTTLLTQREGVWDMEIENGTGRVVRVMEGNWLQQRREVTDV